MKMLLAQLESFINLGLEYFKCLNVLGLQIIVIRYFEEYSEHYIEDKICI